MGKSLIVFYSWVGNTEVVAKEIQKQTGFEIQRIEEKKERKQGGNIMGAALSAVMGLKSSIKPMDYALKDYENIFLGVQVWAGKTTPAINKYLSKTDFKGKKVWVFVTKADAKVPQKVIDSITGRVAKKGGKVADSISFTMAWNPKNPVLLSPEAIKDEISEWLKKGNVQFNQ
jgi:flavodoxin